MKLASWPSFCAYTPVLILIGKMAAWRKIAICKRNVIQIRQVRVKHLKSTLGYKGKLFNNGSMTTTFHILNVQEGVEGHAKDGRCASSRNREIRRNLGK